MELLREEVEAGEDAVMITTRMTITDAAARITTLTLDGRGRDKSLASN